MERYKTFGLDGQPGNFVCFFHFVGWSCISLGLSVDVSRGNIEMHIPFGFIRIGLA